MEGGEGYRQHLVSVWERGKEGEGKRDKEGGGRERGQRREEREGEGEREGPEFMSYNTGQQWMVAMFVCAN